MPERSPQQRATSGRSTGLRRSIARSLDAPAALVPVLGELFAGLDSLGSTPRLVSRLLAEAGLPARARVLDLACGKGAAAVELAARLGCRVIGVDGCAAFVDAAGALAARRGVAGRCEFILADVRDRRALPAGPFDAALMLGLDPVERAAPLLRSRVRRGGLYIIDDACRDPRHAGSWRWAHVPTRSEQEDFIASLGDRVVRVHVPTPSANRRLNERLYRSLATQARAVRLAHPDLAPALRRFLENQRRANRALAGPLRPAIWAVRRG